MTKDNRKRAVSIRMSGSDVGNVKRLAERLGVRDSDVIRYAVKSMLSKLAPLCDPQVRGRNLLPVFVESGADLFVHFELDAGRLEDIINEDAHDDWRVDHEDIQLIAMSGLRTPYASWRSRGTGAAPTLRLMDSAGAPAGTRLRPAAASGVDASGRSLRDYLFEKYVDRDVADA